MERSGRWIMALVLCHYLLAAGSCCAAAAAATTTHTLVAAPGDGVRLDMEDEPTSGSLSRDGAGGGRGLKQASASALPRPAGGWGMAALSAYAAASQLKAAKAAHAAFAARAPAAAGLRAAWASDARNSRPAAKAFVASAAPLELLQATLLAAHSARGALMAASQPLSQGRCSAGVALAVAAAAEVAVATGLADAGLSVANGAAMPSVSQLHFCQPGAKRGCTSAGNWTLEGALKMLTTTASSPAAAANKLYTAGCMPYAPASALTGVDQCRAAARACDATLPAGVFSYAPVGSVEDAQAALLAGGAVVTTMLVYDDLARYFARAGSMAVYRRTTAPQPSPPKPQAVAVVGYDSGSAGGGHWLVRGWAGPAWADAGFFRVAYGEAGIMAPGSTYALAWKSGTAATPAPAPASRDWLSPACFLLNASTTATAAATAAPTTSLHRVAARFGLPVPTLLSDSWSEVAALGEPLAKAARPRLCNVTSATARSLLRVADLSDGVTPVSGAPYKRVDTVDATFWVVPVPVDQPTAEAFCKAEGGRIASVQRADEQAALVAGIAAISTLPSVDVWLGLRRRPVNGTTPPAAGATATSKGERASLTGAAKRLWTWLDGAGGLPGLPSNGGANNNLSAWNSALFPSLPASMFACGALRVNRTANAATTTSGWVDATCGSLVGGFACRFAPQPASDLLPLAAPQPTVSQHTAPTGEPYWSFFLNVTALGSPESGAIWLVSAKKTMAAAEAFCRANGGHLASVKSQAALDQLRVAANYARASAYYYVGLMRGASSGGATNNNSTTAVTFKTVGGGSDTPAFARWAPAQPLGWGDCAVMVAWSKLGGSAFMADVPCDLQVPFACEFPVG